MKNIIFKSKENVNLSSYTELSNILSSIAILKGFTTSNDLISKIYELKYESIGNDLIIDLDACEVNDLEYEVVKIISHYIYEYVSVKIEYTYKNKKGVKKIFEKEKNKIIDLPFKDIVEYLKSVPDKLRFEHRLSHLVKKHLHAIKVNESTLFFDIYNTLVVLKFIKVRKVYYDDLELFKIEVK